MRAQQEDPVIPFRVSNSNAIASNTAMIKLLVGINSAEMSILVIVLTVLLMKSGG